MHFPFSREVIGLHSMLALSNHGHVFMVVKSETGHNDFMHVKWKMRTFKWCKFHNENILFHSSFKCGLFVWVQSTDTKLINNVIQFYACRLWFTWQFSEFPIRLAMGLLCTMNIFTYAFRTLHSVSFLQWQKFMFKQISNWFYWKFSPYIVIGISFDWNMQYAGNQGTLTMNFQCNAWYKSQ